MTASTNFEFSELVFGTWRLADTHSADPKDILTRIKECISLGITTFDLADIYGYYTYEKLFGNALALEPALRSQIQLVTKCDILINCEQKPDVQVHHYDTSKSYIKSCVDKSLKDIGTDYLDVLLLHRPDPLMDANEVSEAFQDLLKEGKVKYFGVSNFTTSQFELLQSRLPFKLVTNQVEFSVLQLKAMYDGTFDQMQRLNVRPMIWSALAGGKLFNEKTPEIKRIVDRLMIVAKTFGPKVTIDQVILLIGLFCVDKNVAM